MENIWRWRRNRYRRDGEGRAGWRLTLAISAVSPITLLPHLGKLPFDPVNDVAPVASVMYSPVYVLATPAFTGKTSPMCWRNRRQSQAPFASPPAVSPPLGHLMVKSKAKSGLELIHVPYKGGGQVVTDAAGGQFELFTTNPSPAANGQMQKGTLKLLAVGAPQRLASFKTSQRWQSSASRKRI